MDPLKSKWRIPCLAQLYVCVTMNRFEDFKGTQADMFRQMGNVRSSQRISQTVLNIWSMIWWMSIILYTVCLVLKLESDEPFMCVDCFKYEFSQHDPARSRNWSLNTLTTYPGMRLSPISSSGNSSPRRTPRSTKSRGASAAAAAGSQQDETTKSPRVSEKEGRTKNRTYS